MPDKRDPRNDGTLPTRPHVLDLIETHDYGLLADDLAAAVDEVVKGVKNSLKKGSVTLVIEVEPAAKDMADILTVSMEVKAKVPRTGHGAAVMWEGKEGGLVNRDPRQMQIGDLIDPRRQQEQLDAEAERQRAQATAAREEREQHPDPSTDH